MVVLLVVKMFFVVVILLLVGCYFGLFFDLGFGFMGCCIFCFWRTCMFSLEEDTL